MGRRSGQIRWVTVDRISNSGNGVVETEDGGQFIVGPVKQEVVGKRIKVKFVSQQKARPLDSSLRNDVYANQSENNNSELEDGQVISGRIGKRTSEGVPIIETEGTRIKVPGADLNESVTVRVNNITSGLEWATATGERIEEKEKTVGGSTKTKSNEYTPASSGNTTASGSSGQKSKSIESMTSENVSKENPNQTQPERNGDNPVLQESDAGSSRSPSIKPEVLAELRSRAENQGSEDPSRSDVSSTSKFVRSSTVKDYAKARSGGNCEWCHNPAPFQSKTGEPYLEVHHVEELADGGADTPEMVVALCPTCHSRVHYGAEGEQLNSKIKKKLRNKIE